MSEISFLSFLVGEYSHLHWFWFRPFSNSNIMIIQPFEEMHQICPVYVISSNPFMKRV
jgi:hypothetical protein